ncbi:MAG: chemotaxis protein CheW [Bacillota bacterium]|jgi:purine-binding chemotaxis protein CheW|nr:purine-binding chemotaxis protein CheW [Candidatus Fermentithermobacillaceae bacterium]
MAHEQTAVAADSSVRHERQIVAFSLGSETYGVDIASVREIIPVPKIVSVPRAPDYVEGIINLRGRVIPVLDLRKHFGFERKKGDPNQRIVLVEAGQESVGVIVDAVSSVLRISDEQVEPAATVIVGAEIEYIQGIAKVDEDLVVLIDLTKIISDAEMRTLREVDLRASIVQ